MMDDRTLLIFGPVPSRRLGKSMGINNIPPKICSYSCVYCQLGATNHTTIKRREFYDPKDMFKQVKKKINLTEKNKERIDYITFVSDGEPTLDIHLAEEIKQLHCFDIPIAVITNASLIDKKEVRDDLSYANWVSIKIDAISDSIWTQINRPDTSLNLNDILKGIESFARGFNGELTTETMLIKNINDSSDEIEKIATFISDIKPDKSYLSIPTRPPAEPWVEPTTEKDINQAFQIFKEKHIETEYLIGYEGNEFAFTGNAETDILSITSVHPMRKEGIETVLEKAHADWSVVETLIQKQKLIELSFHDTKYYMRVLPTYRKGE